ncbi:MAG: SH3 domain-containing protein [Candidatus Marinimicrobia bacterium]|nr:SH3 domain-containing protein [Candidatus Neomarinimicrobiota bacterium]
MYRKIVLLLLAFLAGFAAGRFSLPVNSSEESMDAEQKKSITQTDTLSSHDPRFPEIRWVESNVVNVRSEPGLGAPVLDQLLRGDSVLVQDTTGEWSRIDLGNNMTGWIFSPLLADFKIPPLPAIQVGEAQQSVIEKNELWWRYSYQVTLVVNRPTRENKKVIIKFVDSDGFALDNDITYLPMFDRPQNHTIRDSKLIDLPLAEDVNSIIVSVE